MSDEPIFDPRRKAAIRELVVSNAAAHPRRAGGRKRTTLVVTLVVLALTISGGTVAYALGTGLIDLPPIAAPATPTATAAPTPAPTPTPTPTATPTAPAQNPADPATWIIGFDGVGPVTLDAPYDSQAQSIPTFDDVTDQICLAEQRNYMVPGGMHLTVVAASDGSGRTAAIEFGNYGDGSDRRSASPKTEAGIGVSSTRAELMAAYPDIQQTGTYSDTVVYYGLTDGRGGWIAFAVMNDVVFEIQIGNDAVLPVGQGTVRAIPSERCPA